MNTTAVLDLAVELGYQLQVAGGEIYRVEESITRVLAAYGIQGGEVFAIPNCIIASLSDQGQALTRIRRVGNHGTDIWRLEAMNALCRRLCRVPLPPAEARRELEETLEREPYYPQWVTLLAHFVAAASFCLFFGGGGWDALCAGCCGAAIGLCLWLARRLGAGLFLKTIAAGAVSALLALAFVAAGLGRGVDLITIGALMLLVPGVALTTAVREIMVGDMVSGLSRLAEAILIAVAIALGTGVALAAGRLLGGAL